MAGVEHPLALPDTLLTSPRTLLLPGSTIGGAPSRLTSPPHGLPGSAAGGLDTVPPPALAAPVAVPAHVAAAAALADAAAAAAAADPPASGSGGGAAAALPAEAVPGTFSTGALATLQWQVQNLVAQEEQRWVEVTRLNAQIARLTRERNDAVRARDEAIIAHEVAQSTVRIVLATLSTTLVSCMGCSGMWS